MSVGGAVWALCYRGNVVVLGVNGEHSCEEIGRKLYRDILGEIGLKWTEFLVCNYLFYWLLINFLLLFLFR